MKRRYFPVLARSVLFVAALAVVALGPNVRRSLFAASQQRDPAFGLPLPQKNHSRRRRWLGLPHIRLPHSPSLHLPPNKSHRPRRGLRKSRWRNSQYRRSPRHRPRARIQSRLHLQRPRRHHNNFRSEDSRRHRQRSQAGTNPDAILYDPASKRVFAMNGRSSNATVVDAATGKVAATIPLAGKPEFAVADGAGHVYVNIEDKSELWQIDSQKLTVTARWPLAPCEEPTGLAIDDFPDRRPSFAGCGNKMMAVVDADSGKVIAAPPIGDGVDEASAGSVGVCAGRCGHGLRLRISGPERHSHHRNRQADSPDKFTVVENVPTQTGRPHNGARSQNRPSLPR